MAETFFGVSMIPMNYKDEVRQIKSELLCFLGHPNGLVYYTISFLIEERKRLNISTGDKHQRSIKHQRLSAIIIWLVCYYRVFETDCKKNSARDRDDCRS